LKKNR